LPQRRVVSDNPPCTMNREVKKKMTFRSNNQTRIRANLLFCNPILRRKVARSNEFVCHPQIALVPKFIKQTTDSSFVLF